MSADINKHIVCVDGWVSEWGISHLSFAGICSIFLFDTLPLQRCSIYDNSHQHKQLKKKERESGLVSE